MPSSWYSLFPKNCPFTKVLLNSDGFSPFPIWKKFLITPGTRLYSSDTLRLTTGRDSTSRSEMTTATSVFSV